MGELGRPAGIRNGAIYMSGPGAFGRGQSSQEVNLPGQAGCRKTRLARKYVDDSPDGVGSMDDAMGSTDHFKVFRPEKLNRTPVLVRPGAHGGMIEPDAVREQNVMVSGQPSKIGGRLAQGRFLDHHGGKTGEGFGHRPRAMPEPARLHLIGGPRRGVPSFGEAPSCGYHQGAQLTRCITVGLRAFGSVWSQGAKQCDHWGESSNRSGW